jgi:hypothetical protein
MPEPVDRVMQAYSMMVTLSPEEEAQARDRVTAHLSGLEGDETVLAVAGLRFLRGQRRTRKRRSDAGSPRP